MHGEPEPSGHRLSPPPSIRTALSASNPPSERVVLLHLLDTQEEDLFTRAFEGRNWRVLIADDLIDLIAAIEDSPRLVITDDPGFARLLPENWEEASPPVMVVVDDRDTAVQGAWRAGADWVITRPFNPEDPIGFNFG
jgi:DNA-binding response OmpR family regulator